MTIEAIDNRMEKICCLSNLLANQIELFTSIQGSVKSLLW
jgi:hypothetical protein